MESRLQWFKQITAVFFLFFLLGSNGCDSGKHYAGTYVAVSEGQPTKLETIIELKEDYQGVWTTNEKEVPFRWSAKGKEIRFHTKEGGVITGKITKDTITVMFSGDNAMSFKKRNPY